MSLLFIEILSAVTPKTRQVMSAYIKLYRAPAPQEWHLDKLWTLHLEQLKKLIAGLSH